MYLVFLPCFRFKPFQALQFETFLMRKRTKTQNYKGVPFEQFESAWVQINVHLQAPVLDETEQKTRKEKRHKDQRKVNEQSIKTAVS